MEGKNKKMDEIKLRFKEAQGGDEDAKREIIQHYHYLIDNTVRTHPTYDESSVYHGAYLGLLHAIQCYDFRGAFESYAFVCCRRRARREVQKDMVVHIPSDKFEEHRRLGQPAYEVVHLDGQDAKRLCFLDELITEQSGKSDSFERQIFLNEINEILESCMEGLNYLEKDAIKQRYDFIDESLVSLGRKHGVSGEWIRLVCIEATKKLKKSLGEKLNRKEVYA